MACYNKPIECQIKWLDQSILESEELLKKYDKTDTVCNYINVLEEFIRSRKVICYGGTAINNILPTHAQFYNENDISDYDLYSIYPMQDAKDLADIYFKMGVSATASSGVHEGTFKVYVDFIPIADFTYLSPHTFGILQNESITIDGIMYCSPNFLRMNVITELAHPLNAPDRLKKVFLRFQLLNRYYPMVSPPVCEKYNSLKLPNALLSVTIHSLMEQNIVFIGEFAYFNYFKNEDTHKPSEFDVICENTDIVCPFLVQRLRDAGAKNVTFKFHGPQNNDPRFQHVEIYIGAIRWITLWKPYSSINYNEVVMDKKWNYRTLRIGSPETVMLYLFYFYYLERPFLIKSRLLCMISFILKKYLTDNNNYGVWKRFSVLCYGKTIQLKDIRAQKAAKYLELKGKESSLEYQWLFLKYEPKQAKQAKTRHHTRKAKVRKS
jgi:hypothetical protein